MLVRVKHNELNQFAKDISNNSSDLDIEIDNMLKELDVLKSVWQGQDSNIFYKNLYNYLNKMKLISHTMNVFSEFIVQSDKMYVEQDEAFARRLQQEVNYDE